MSRPDHFALQRSELNPFLFADIGTELNGSTLTMLSVLARLGKDPWVEAASWAKVPKAAAVESIITTIASLPLASRTLGELRVIATRIVMLLPVQDWLPYLKAPMPTRPTIKALGASLGVGTLPRWLPMLLVACALVLGVAFNLLHAPISLIGSAAVTQTKVQTEAPR